MKIKVLIIPESYPTDENPVAGIFIKDQIKALLPRCEITIFNSNPWYRGQYEEVEGVRFFDFHLFSNRLPTITKPIGYAWWEQQSLRVAKKIPKPDIIHLHGAAMRGKMVEKLAAFWNIPYVVTEHTGPWSAIADRPRIFARAKQTLERAAAVMSVSNHLKQEMIDSGVNSKSWEVFGNPVDTEFFSSRSSSLAASRNILFLGRLDDFKGGLRTLKAFHKVLNDISDFRLTIAGTGVESEAIAQYIVENDLSDRVEFLNQSLSREEMKMLFHRASFLVFPSLFESFGLVAAEAMATGLPVIITDHTGPRDFTNPTVGIAVNPESIDEIGEAMVRMIGNLDSYSSVDILGFVEEKFGMIKYSDQVLECYDQAIRIER
ncbi:glycosyltransferase family 4 protein [Cryomorpha ignava]|uniref:Glycosyltransferase family 4 protein n=1 Tax=Cryomorpha ignava TaxID=101383 RepID=A0A7K3WVS0_9FLAO|nr:glycosyltransferase [Cryomorpha ignava]NEN25733.1 glycosyltransferase family 4 protein [Cryomorpha ignava]